MSVDITARYGRGYFVPYDDIVELSEKKQLEFKQSGYAYKINGYDDCSDYFFGLTIKACDVGEIGVVPISADGGNFVEITQLHKQFFPNADHFARYYLFAQYW